MNSKMNSTLDRKKLRVHTQDFLTKMEVKDVNDITTNNRTSALCRTSFPSYFTCRVTHSRKNKSVIPLIIHQIVTFILIANVSGKIII